MTECERQQIHDFRLKGVGYKAIAAVLGLSRDTVRGYCKRSGLDDDSKGGTPNAEEREPEPVCDCCGQVIAKKDHRRNRRFCSDGCRQKWWADNYDARNKKPESIYKYSCLHCGKKFSAYGDKERKYCSPECYFKARVWSKEEIASRKSI